MRIITNKPKKRGAMAGFSLAEVMVGSMTLLIMSGSLYTGIGYGLNVVRAAREDLRANQILVDKLEAVRLYNWTQLNSQWVNPTFTEQFNPNAAAVAAEPAVSQTAFADDGPSIHREGTGGYAGKGLLYHGTVQLLDAGVSSAYNDITKRVVVTVTWTSGNVTRTRTGSTLISQYGTQKFIDA